MGRQSPPRVNTVSFGFYAGTGIPRPMNVSDQHNEMELNFIECGGIVLRRGVETVTLRAGEGIVYWAAVPHQILSVEPATKLTWIVLPLSWFLGWRLGPSFTRRLLEGGILSLNTETARPGNGEGREMGTVFSFAGWGRDFASGSAKLKAIVRLELEAFFLRLAESWDASKKAGVGVKRRQQVGTSRMMLSPDSCPTLSITETHQCHHVERMVRYINAHFHEQITVTMIAREAKLNPAYAMRLFRRRWGITLWRFLIQQRLSEARRLLLLSDMPLAEVALACGFQSLSRFYEAFKSECECSPGTYRKQHVPDVVRQEAG